MEILKQYFHLTEHQEQQFAVLGSLYQEWNQKINVISRKDIDNLYEHHILHSLSIAKVLHFDADTRILDVGTGGGLPGIPLAILFPECQFYLLDSIGKKIRVATAIAQEAGLSNVTTMQKRMEEEQGKYDFIVSRAVMPLQDLVKLTRKNVSPKQHNALPNGMICLKGGELDREILPFKNIAEMYQVSDFFKEEYFDTKKIVYLPIH